MNKLKSFYKKHKYAMAFTAIYMSIFLLISLVMPVFGSIDKNISANKAVKLIDLLASDKLKDDPEYYVVDRTDEFGNYIRMAQVIRTVPTSPKGDFSRDLRRVRIYDIGAGIHLLELAVRHITETNQEKVHTFEEWIMLAGEKGFLIPGRQYKGWNLTIEKHQGYEGNDVLIYPFFPKGMINQKWKHPTMKEYQAKFEKELSYWIREFDLYT